jgi:hypothetical protein
MFVNPLLAAAVIELVVSGFIFIADDDIAIAHRGPAMVHFAPNSDAIGRVCGPGNPTTLMPREILEPIRRP